MGTKPKQLALLMAEEAPAPGSAALPPLLQPSSRLTFPSSCPCGGTQRCPHCVTSKWEKHKTPFSHLSSSLCPQFPPSLPSVTFPVAVTEPRGWIPTAAPMELGSRAPHQVPSAAVLPCSSSPWGNTSVPPSLPLPAPNWAGRRSLPTPLIAAPRRGKTNRKVTRKLYYIYIYKKQRRGDGVITHRFSISTVYLFCKCHCKCCSMTKWPVTLFSPPVLYRSILTVYRTDFYLFISRVWWVAVCRPSPKPQTPHQGEVGVMGGGEDAFLFTRGGCVFLVVFARCWGVAGWGGGV